MKQADRLYSAKYVKFFSPSTRQFRFLNDTLSATASVLKDVDPLTPANLILFVLIQS